MSRSTLVVGALVLSGAVAVFGCVDETNFDTEGLTSELTCAMAGTGGGAIDITPVRGFTASGGSGGVGGHRAVFRADGTNIRQSSGTPFGSPVLVASGAMNGSSPWGYVRHDGPNVVLYIDQNRHIHEVGSSDIDFHLSFGINAPIAASAPPGPPVGPVPDVIGYVRSDAKSGIVYLDTNNHVIEITSNFSGQPPWLANDLTTIASATVTAKGSAFPYVRSDGRSAIVYVGTDNHIHELSNTGPAGWSDSDLHVLSSETVVPTTDPWGFLPANLRNNVLFVGADGALHEFVLIPGNQWVSAPLPAVQPVGGANARPSGYVGPDGLTAVVYVSSAGSPSPSLHQLTLSGNFWTDQRLPTSCVVPFSQPFGHATGNRSSILFMGSLSFSGSLPLKFRYELSKSVGGTWSLTAF